MGTWTNRDGLFVAFGTDEAANAAGGEYQSDSLTRTTDHTITLTALSSSAALITGDQTRFARNFVPVRVTVIADVAATSGGSAVLNVGFVRATDGSTEVDNDGLVAALPLANINVLGETNVLTAGVTYAGALVGTVASATYNMRLVAYYGTAAFTAGKVRIIIEWQRRTSTT